MEKIKCEGCGGINYAPEHTGDKLKWLWGKDHRGQFCGKCRRLLK